MQEFNTWNDETKPKVLCDNKAVCHWINGSNHNARTRGLDLLYYSIWHLVQDDIKTVQHVSGADNESDLLTKILSKVEHWKHTRSILGLKRLPKLNNRQGLEQLLRYLNSESVINAEFLC